MHGPDPLAARYRFAGIVSFPRAWARLPGPMDLLDTVLEDLADRIAVLAGLPEDFPSGALTVEASDLVKHRGLGRWEPVRSSEARTMAPADTLARRFKNGGAGSSVLWVDTVGDDAAAKSWADHARRLAELPDTPRLCIMMNAMCARLRRRLWREFVTPLDARALVERIGRRSGHSRAHSMLRSTVIAELAGSDLTLAERLSHESLKGMIQADESTRERIWRAQVSVLLPLVEGERQRLLDAYRTLWRLPHLRKDGKQIESLEDLEIGDMATQVRSIGLPNPERPRLRWLLRVRNALAHNEVVSWDTLTSPIAIRIVDFRGIDAPSR